MNDIERLIDQVLASSPSVEPSPSFVARVMSSIRNEADLPPIAFPAWRFAIAAVLLVTVVVAAGVSTPGLADSVIPVPVSFVPLTIASLATALVASIATDLRRAPRR